MTIGMIVTFKQYPELGRLKVVITNPIAPCNRCALNRMPCDKVDLNYGCTLKGYHYEPAGPR